MLGSIIRWVMLALALMLIAFIIPGIAVETFFAALIAVLVFGLVNMLIKPFIMALTLPVNMLTLGLFTFIINAALFMLVAAIVPGFVVEGFGVALIGSILFSIFSMIIGGGRTLSPA